MMRFSITDLLLGMALIAICLTAVTCDGCGKRVRRVSNIAFAPDGRTIAVDAMTARSHRRYVAFGRTYFTRISRTLSLHNAAKGSRERSITSQSVAGGRNNNDSHDYRDRRQSPIDFRANGQLAYSDLRTGALAIAHGSVEPWGDESLFGVSDLGVSADGQVLAVGVARNVVLYRSNQRIASFAHRGIQGHARRSSVDVSTDGNLCSYVDSSNLVIADVRSGQALHTFDCGHWPVAAKWLGNNRILVEFTGRGSVDDACIVFDTHDVAPRSVLRGLSITGTSSKASRFAAFDGTNQSIKIIDRGTLNVQLEIPTGELPDDDVQSLALSDDGSKLAVGTNQWVVVFDLDTGNELWRVRPKFRYRLHVLFPVMLFYAWILGARRRAQFLRRQTLRST